MEMFCTFKNNNSFFNFWVKWSVFLGTYLNFNYSVKWPLFSEPVTYVHTSDSIPWKTIVPLPNNDFYEGPGVFGRIIVFLCIWNLWRIQMDNPPGATPSPLRNLRNSRWPTMASDDRVHHFDCFSNFFLIFQIIKIIYISDELESIMQHVVWCQACSSLQNLNPLMCVYVVCYQSLLCPIL